MADLKDIVRTRHRVSGAIDENTPRHIAEHPILGAHLDIVDPDAKPFVPELHKPKGRKALKVEDVVEVETPDNIDKNGES